MTAEPPHEPALARFVGGLRWRALNATWPLAVLIVDREGGSIKPSRSFLARLGMPTVRFTWRELDAIELVQGIVPPVRLNRGVRFYTEAGPALFWGATRTDEILATVRELSPSTPVNPPVRVI